MYVCRDLIETHVDVKLYTYIHAYVSGIYITHRLEQLGL